MLYCYVFLRFFLIYFLVSAMSTLVCYLSLFTVSIVVVLHSLDVPTSN
jgi:hypothetical protein